MSKKEFIKHCPFCGSIEVDIARTNETACWVECSECYAEAPSAKTRSGAIKIWNRRYAPVEEAIIKYDGDKVFKNDMLRIKNHFVNKGLK